MISDEMLAAAAGEVSTAMHSAIPVSEHTFSPGFEKKMRILIRRGAHPRRQQVLRYAAAVFIAAVTVFGGLYLFSPTVRATVNNWVGSWVRETFGDYIQYHSTDSTRPDVEYDYLLPEEFDGYRLHADSNPAYNVYIYTNHDGQMLSFHYIRGTDNTALFLSDAENHEYHSAYVNSLHADIYIAPNNEDASLIVWYSSEENVLFSICAFATEEELIAFAEKVEKTVKN